MPRDDGWTQGAKQASGNGQGTERFAILALAGAWCKALGFNARVLIALASYATNGNAQAWASIEQLCETMDIGYNPTNRRRVQRALRVLEAERLIVPLREGRGKGQASVWRINRPLVKGGHIRPPLEAEKAVISDPKRRSYPTPKGGHIRPPHQKEQNISEGAPIAPSPSADAHGAEPEPEPEAYRGGNGAGAWSENMADVQATLRDTLGWLPVRANGESEAADLSVRTDKLSEGRASRGVGSGDMPDELAPRPRPSPSQKNLPRVENTLRSEPEPVEPELVAAGNGDGLERVSRVLALGGEWEP